MEKMTFNIEKEKRSLDRFWSWWEIKYGGDTDSHICDGCLQPCGCLTVHGMYESEDRIWKTYTNFMSSQITSKSKIGAAKQAFWANIKFCENFRDYFWMDWDRFGDEAQYYTWRDFCIEELGIRSEDGEIWEVNDFGEHELIWEKPLHGVWFKMSQKYKTWQDPHHGMIEV